jgi:predicted ATP-grasp superfamily ATP-dependent carboligase
MSARAALGEAPGKALRAETFGDLTVALDRARRYGVPFIVQEYIPGNEDCLYSYHAYRDGGGCVLGSYVGRKIRTYPRYAGVSTYLELVKEPHIAELGERILANLEIVGPVKLDFKRDARTGQVYLLEVNARFTLWNHLGAACGVNLPEIAYHDLIGERRPATSEYRTGVRWLSFGNDLRGFIREYRRSGALSWSDWLGTYRGKLVYDVFSWRDPMPFAASVWSYTRALATRFGHAALLSGD